MKRDKTSPPKPTFGNSSEEEDLVMWSPPQKKTATETRQSGGTTNTAAIIPSDDSSDDDNGPQMSRVQQKKPTRRQRSTVTGTARLSDTDESSDDHPNKEQSKEVFEPRKEAGKAAVNSVVHKEAEGSTDNVSAKQNGFKNRYPFLQFENFSKLDLQYLHGRFMEYKNPEFDQLVIWGLVTQRDVYQIFRWVKAVRLACGEAAPNMATINRAHELTVEDASHLKRKCQENSYPTVSLIESWASEIQKTEELVLSCVKKNYEKIQEEAKKQREAQYLALFK